MTARYLDVVVAGTVAPTVGGIASAIDDHVAGLRRAGMRVEVLNTGRARRPRPGRPSAGNIVAAGTDAWRLAVFVRRRRAPLVDVHTVGSPVLPLLRALALVVGGRLMGARAVVHLHGYDLARDIDRATRPYAAAIRALARLSSAVVILHDDLAVRLLRLAPSMRTEVIPNCIDCDDSAVATPAPGPTRIVFVGTVGRRKGADDLVDALAQVRGDVCADIVGGGAEEGPDAYRRIVDRAQDLVTGGRAVFHGERSRDDARSILRAGQLFVLPSRAEALPVALLEAMDAGLATVVTDVAAMGDLVRRAGCGIVVPPGDVDALAAAIQALVDDPQRRGACARAARRAVRDTYCCEQTVGSLMRLYERVGH